MYAIVYYKREMVVGESVVEKEYHRGEVFRLRRNALHYVLDIVRSDLMAEGYGTEPMVGGIFCYKSERLEKGNRKIIQVRVKVEKA